MIESAGGSQFRRRDRDTDFEAWGVRVLCADRASVDLDDAIFWSGHDQGDVSLLRFESGVVDDLARGWSDSQRSFPVRSLYPALQG